MNPNMINNIKAFWSSKKSDKYPIITGPNRNPMYAIVETPAMAMEGSSFF